MELQAKLDAIREASKTRLPPEIRSVMQEHIARLTATGIADRVVRVGQPAPDFMLPNAIGRSVSLADLRAGGPVVLSFYRGRW
jgi:AhpC/TSA family